MVQPFTKLRCTRTYKSPIEWLLIIFKLNHNIIICLQVFSYTMCFNIINIYSTVYLHIYAPIAKAVLFRENNKINVREIGSK